MHKRQLTIVGVVLTAAAILFAITTYRQQAQDKSQSGKDEATVVQRGQVTDKEREYSKEYKKLYSGMITKLPELAAEANARKNTTELVIRIYQEAPFFFGNEPKNRDEFLSRKGCGADAIVIAAADTKTAHLVEDETFIYTQYDFQVREVLKNNSAFPISPNDRIEVTRPGGLIRLDGQNIRIIDENIALLELKKEYVLFLRWVPTANGYVPADFDADFLIEGNSSKSLAHPSAAPADVKAVRAPRSQLITQIKAAVLAGCRKESSEVK